MKSLMAKHALLAMTAVMTLGLAVPQASADGLFDMLFGGHARRQAPLKGEFPPPPKQRKVVPVQRIASPTYNTYKADRLVPVDFSALTVPSTTGATAQNACQGTQDSVGIYLKFKHPGVTKVLFDEMDLTSHTVMRLEPIPPLQAGGCK